jgi:hypothetical protein
MNNPIPVTVSILLLAVSNLPAATLYVWQDSPCPMPPYDTWLSQTEIGRALGECWQALVAKQTFYVGSFPGGHSKLFRGPSPAAARVWWGRYWDGRGFGRKKGLETIQ